MTGPRMAGAWWGHSAVSVMVTSQVTQGTAEVELVTVSSCNHGCHLLTPLNQLWLPFSLLFLLCYSLHLTSSSLPCFVFISGLFSSSSSSLLCSTLSLPTVFSSPATTPLSSLPPSLLSVSGGSRLCSRHSATCPCHS